MNYYAGVISLSTPFDRPRIIAQLIKATSRAEAEGMLKIKADLLVEEIQQARKDAGKEPIHLMVDTGIGKDEVLTIENVEASINE